ncbi:MAG: polysaccharide biosynthesis protein [Gammaproteobacteria bacterium]|nr:MAG: polysaccharide biosynthesis protein [Gammaproteobacteria bacterium]
MTGEYTRGNRLFSLVSKRLAVFVHDLLWIPLALFLAFLIRFGFEGMQGGWMQAFWSLLLLALPVQALVNWRFGLYRGIWRFASLRDLARITKSLLLGVAVTFLLHFLFFRLEGVPRTVLVLYPLLLGMGLSLPRLFYRLYKDHRLMPERGDVRRALIVGAGRAGEQLVRDMLRSGEYAPIGFLDDDSFKQGREIHGVSVIGTLDELEQVVARLEPDDVIIAVPSADAGFMRTLYRRCRDLGVHCMTLPPLSELGDEQVGLGGLRDIGLEDLLGREEVVLDEADIHAMISGKRVLVTGAGGSIGSELCRQILDHQPQRLTLLDNGEFALYSIERELRSGMDDPGMLHAVLADVRDPARMAQVFDEGAFDLVFHAAAYKHVPLVEENPVEGLRTNVLGTRVVADLCAQHDVDRFVMVSTDKAVNPTNVMGASKRLAEIYCQALNEHARTRYITTRFGNVLGSTGSVVPLFREQIRQGGPVTVTHPDVKRYFMTIPEAVRLVLQAASMGEGGEIFVLDMGEPVRIVDLARQMIELSGLEPEKDIAIEYIGLRPGEKLFEELFHDNEQLMGTRHAKILLARARRYELRDVQDLLTELSGLCGRFDPDTMYALLQRLVPEYQPDRRAAAPNTETQDRLH